MANDDIERQALQLLRREPESEPTAAEVTEGLRWRQALAYYCPEKTGRFREARTALAGGSNMGAVVARFAAALDVTAGSTSRDDTPTQAAYTAAQVELHIEFFGKLAAGDLEATYRPEPPHDNWQRELIPRTMWSTLLTDLKKAGRWPRPWYCSWEHSRLLYGSSKPSHAAKRYDDIRVFPRGMASEAQHNANSSPATLAPASAPNISTGVAPQVRRAFDEVQIAELDGLAIVEAMDRLATDAAATDAVPALEASVYGDIDHGGHRWSLFASERLATPLETVGRQKGLLIIGGVSQPDDSQELAAQANHFTNAVRSIFEALRAGAVAIEGCRWSGTSWSHERSRLDADRWRWAWQLRRIGHDAVLETDNGKGGWQQEMLRLRVLVAAPRATADQPNPAPEAREAALARRTHIPDAELRSWYNGHVAKFRERHGRAPSRDDDWSAAQEAYSHRVSRDKVRAMRATFEAAGSLEDARPRGRPRRGSNSAE
ncbi:MAG: hypothetical protein ACLQJR_08130 [Stellaceae bacterium]